VYCCKGKAPVDSSCASWKCTLCSSGSENSGNHGAGTTNSVKLRAHPELLLDRILKRARVHVDTEDMDAKTSSNHSSNLTKDEHRPRGMSRDGVEDEKDGDGDNSDASQDRTDIEMQDSVHLLDSLSLARRTTRDLDKIMEAPEYHPTEEEFSDPIAYVRSIQDEAARYGICKITPPASWNPGPFTFPRDKSKRFTTRVQFMDQLKRGFGYVDGKHYTLDEFRVMAHRFYRKHVSSADEANEQHRPLSEKEVEQLYWNMVTTATVPLSVEYGNDISSVDHGSGFEYFDPQSMSSLDCV
jgi:jmjN domain